LRIRSIALNRPVEMSHERGFAGVPSTGSARAQPRTHPEAPPREIEVAEQADQGGEDAAGFAR